MKPPRKVQHHISVTEAGSWSLAPLINYDNCFCICHYKYSFRDEMSQSDIQELCPKSATTGKKKRQVNAIH